MMQLGIKYVIDIGTPPPFSACMELEMADEQSPFKKRYE